jgi:DNA-binding NarL/FixJ family response regulator
MGDIEDLYDDALRNCEDAEAIRNVFKKHPLKGRGKNGKVRHDTLQYNEGRSAIGVFTHPIDVIEPPEPPAYSRNWVLQALTHGNNREILVAVYWARGLSLRGIANSISISHDTVKRIIHDLNDRYS